MKVEELTKGQSFTVKGWRSDIVLIVLIPAKAGINQCVIKGIHNYLGTTGIAILAGKGQDTKNGLKEDMYCIPITAEVSMVG